MRCICKREGCNRTFEQGNTLRRICAYHKSKPHNYRRPFYEMIELVRRSTQDVIHQSIMMNHEDITHHVNRRTSGYWDI